MPAYTSQKNMSTPSKLCIDHIIILVPYVQLHQPPSWLVKNFTLTPGGRHADNKTENKLIVFRDGSYIELIAYINDDPVHRKGHYFGDKEFGIIDFALTSSTPRESASETRTAAEQTYDAVTGRLKTLNSALGIGYTRPNAGGRKRDDGQDIRWEVMFPTGTKSGEVPFFCHDLTDRRLRAPMDETHITHPCGAYGVKELNIYVPRAQLEELAKVYGKILGVDNKAENDAVAFEVQRVEDVEGVPRPRICLKAMNAGQGMGERSEGAGVVLRETVLGGFDHHRTGADGRFPKVDDDENALGNITIEYDAS